MSAIRTRSIRGASAWPLLLIVLAIAAIAGLYFAGVFDGARDTETDGDNDARVAGDELTGEGPSEGEELTASSTGSSATLAGLYGKGDVGAIRLRLVRAGTKSPVPGQDVELRSRRDELVDTVKSDDQGSTVFAKVRPGSGHRIVIRAANVPVISLTDIRVRLRETTDLGDIPVGKDIALRGRVISSKGKPVPGALVFAYLPTSTSGRDGILFERTRLAQKLPTPVEQTTTDDKGFFALSSIEDGTYSVASRKSGFASAQVNDIVIARELGCGNLKLMLGSGTSVRGRVTDGEEKPIANAAVVASRDRGGRSMMVGNLELDVARTDARGEFLIDTLSLGARYRFGVLAEGYAPVYTGQAEPVTLGAQRDFTLKEGGSIVGIVTDDATGEPVEGAEVATFVGQMRRGNSSSGLALTDAKGRFELKNLQPGPVMSIGFKARGYITSSRSMWTGNQLKDVTSGSVEEVSVALKRGGSILGKVTDANTGKPLQGAEVTAVSPISMFTGGPVAISDANGQYKLEGVADGNVTVVATYEGYAQPASDTATNVEGDEVTVDVKLTAAGIVTGVVVDSAGEPVEGARVRVAERREQTSRGGWSADARRNRSASRIRTGTLGSSLTDAAGKFQLRGVAPDVTWVVAATADGFVESESKKFKVDAGANENVKVLMLKGGSIKGRVVGDDGRWIKGAIVRVGTLSEALAKKAKMNAWEARGSLGSDTYATDAEGQFQVDGLKPGRILVQVTMDEYVTWSKRDIRMANEQVVGNYMIKLSRGETIEGIVVDAEGKPVRRAGVGVSTDPNPSSDGSNSGDDQEDDDVVAPTNFARTGDDGTFKIENVPPREYSVMVWFAQGYKTYGRDQAESAIKRRVMVPTRDKIEFVLEKQAPGANRGR